MNAAIGQTNTRDPDPAQLETRGAAPKPPAKPAIRLSRGCYIFRQPLAIGVVRSDSTRIVKALAGDPPRPIPTRPRHGDL